MSKNNDKFRYWKILAREIDNYHLESVFILILIKTASQIQSLKNFVSAISLILGNEFYNNTDPTMDRRLQLAGQIDLKEVQVVINYMHKYYILSLKNKELLHKCERGKKNCIPLAQVLSETVRVPLSQKGAILFPLKHLSSKGINNTKVNTLFYCLTIE